jgi:hypothetical protein
LIDKLLSKCGLVRKSQHNRIISRVSRQRYEEGVHWARSEYQYAARVAERKASRATLEAQNAQAQRDTIQVLLNRANRRLEQAGMISVTTFI